MKKEQKKFFTLLSMIFVVGLLVLLSRSVYADGTGDGSGDLLTIGSVGMAEQYQYNPHANRFIIKDENGDVIASKTIKISMFDSEGELQFEKEVKSTDTGHYIFNFYSPAADGFRVEPGEYDLHFTIDGYETYIHHVTIIKGHFQVDNGFTFSGSPETVSMDDVQEGKDITFTLRTVRSPSVNEGKIKIYFDDETEPRVDTSVKSGTVATYPVVINSASFKNGEVHELRAVYESGDSNHYEDDEATFQFTVENAVIASATFPESYQYNEQGNIFYLYAKRSTEDEGEAATVLLTSKTVTITPTNRETGEDLDPITKKIQKNGNLVFYKNSLPPGEYKLSLKIKGYDPYIIEKLTVKQGYFSKFILNKNVDEVVCNSIVDAAFLTTTRSKRIDAGFITFYLDGKEYKKYDLSEKDHEDGITLKVDTSDPKLDPGKHTVLAKYVDPEENYEDVTSREVSFTIAHSWDEGKVTKEATCTEDGEKVYTCTGCKEEKTEVLKAGHKPVKDPAVAATYTATGLTEGSHCSVCKKVLKAQQVIPMLTKPAAEPVVKKPAKVVEKPRLFAQVKKSTKTSNKLTWKKIKGANQYVVYGNKCGDSYSYKKIATVKKTSFNHKKLLTGRCYKYRVVAYKVKGKKKTKLSTSRTIHGCTLGGAVGNCKSIKINKTKVSLKVKKTFAIKAREIISKKKIAFHHRPFAYETSNKKVATVTAAGKIKAVGKGKCKIYVYAQNGKYKTVYVTVK